MTENKGDLISRETLKKDFKDRLEKAKNWKENALNRGDDEIAIRADATLAFICEVIMTIDNAPTVERPQGEWKVNTYGTHFCHKCRHHALYGKDQDNDYYEVQSNFCPFCGAEMEIEL